MIQHIVNQDQVSHVSLVQQVVMKIMRILLVQQTIPITVYVNTMVAKLQAEAKRTLIQVLQPLVLLKQTVPPIPMASLSVEPLLLMETQLVHPFASPQPNVESKLNLQEFHQE